MVVTLTGHQGGVMSAEKLAPIGWFREINNVHVISVTNTLESLILTRHRVCLRQMFAVRICNKPSLALDRLAALDNFSRFSLQANCDKTLLLPRPFTFFHILCQSILLSVRH